MCQVHLQAVFFCKLKFTRALGPRDELDESKVCAPPPCRSSGFVLNLSCPSLGSQTGLLLHGCGAAFQRADGRFISFSTFWIIPAESHHFGEMQSTSKLSQSSKMGKSRHRWANF